MRNALAILITAIFCVSSLAVCRAQNLCPNPGAEEGVDVPADWEATHAGCTWDEQEVHGGKRSLKITADGGYTISWTSKTIPVPGDGSQLVLGAWAKLQEVSGSNGAFMGFYHMDESDERIGQSGMLVIGGSQDEVATKDWESYLSMSNFGREVKGVRVNVRLYGASGTAWFDDISVTPHRADPLKAPVALRRGLRTKDGELAICSADGCGDIADQIRQALAAKGIEADVVGHEEVDLATESRDLIVLGNVTSSRVAEQLYLHSYTCEDLYYPGGGGYVLRPLVNPFGTGTNFLVVTGSDDAGMRAAAARLEELAAPGLDVKLEVKTGEGYLGEARYPWPGSGPRRELRPAAMYIKTGDEAYAEEYRELVLSTWFVSDAELFEGDSALHLYYITRTMSWDLMHTCPIFTDEERLKISNQLLKMLRSDQGYGYSGIAGGMRSRENHGTRAAQAFYYGWRHFAKYYGEEMGAELGLWRRKLKEFWAAPLGSSRSFEDSLSQHALGGSLVNALDIAFMEPEWSKEFFESGRARQMGERCIAIVNNMGRVVLLGDTNASDYPASVFTMLAYKLADGRYQWMLQKRGDMGSSTDEPLRGFSVGVEPAPPTDHIGLTVIPADDMYFRTALQNKEGVEFERAFDKLTIRGGLQAEDEYLMLDGVAGGSHSYDDANSIGEYSANARRWLCEIDIFNGPTMSFHNAVTVANGGLGGATVPQAAELVDSDSGEGWAYTATRLPHYNGVDWTRNLLWVKGKYVFALDGMEAREAGDYSFVLGWRSLGEPRLQAGRFTSAQDEVARTGTPFDGAALAGNVGATSGKAQRLFADYGAVFYRGDEVGDFMETTIRVPRTGRYLMTAAPLLYDGRGIVQVAVDGEDVGEAIDLYAPGRAATRDVRLGEIDLTAGEHVVRFTVTGKNTASDNYTFAFAGLGLHEPGSEPAEAEVGQNRFAILFPADVPATLDRDEETLGIYLPPSPHYEQALNILEQSMNRRLEAGQTASFMNLFTAFTGRDETPYDLRRVNGSCALVRGPEGLTLIGSAEGKAVQLGALSVSGRMFCVGVDGLVLREATATLGGRVLVEGEQREALQAALAAAWEAAAEDGGAADPWAGVPGLAHRWEATLGAKPLSVCVWEAADGKRIVVGTEDGMVQVFKADGTPLGVFETGDQVHALCVADLDGDGAEELLAGSDDENLYALDADLGLIWKRQIPFLREEQIWMWWTLGTSKVRKIHCDDITGDGTPEILVGAGNMRLHCLNAQGEEMWRYRTDHGICTTITTADVYGDGKKRVVAGNGLTSSSGNCWVLDEAGKVLATYYNGSWCTSLPAVAVADLDGDGKATVFCGNNRGDVRAYPPGYNKPGQLWQHNLTRPVRSLTPAGDVIVVGSDSGYLCAFGPDGEKAWGTALSSGIPFTAGLAEDIVAGCGDGNVFVVSAGGEIEAREDLGARLMGMISAGEEIAAVTAGPDRVLVLGRDG